MKIAFYAPLKSPNDPTPSGDRQIARNLMIALEHAGHTVELASNLRTFEGSGNPKRQTDLKSRALAEVETLLTTWRNSPGNTPDIWITYHVYHKAPDWIGRAITSALGIPYVIVEASISPKASKGNWQSGYAAAQDAIGAADLILGLNPRDTHCVRVNMKPSATYQLIAPFIDPSPFHASRSAREQHRYTFSRTHDIDSEIVWILTVGMMRNGDKYQSYEMLSKSLDHIHDSPWHLVCVGDGPAHAKVKGLFSQHKSRTTWLGALSPEVLPSLYATSDIFAWPAINEALGMVFLEAGVSGLPCVAGYTDGVASIIEDGKTGLLSPAQDTEGFASNLHLLITSNARRRALGQNAQVHINQNHSMYAATETLRASLSRFEPVHIS